MTITSNTCLSSLIGFAANGQVLYCSEELLKLFQTEKKLLGSAHDLLKDHPQLLGLLSSLESVVSKAIEVKIDQFHFLVEAKISSDLMPGAKWIMSFSNITFIRERELKLLKEKTHLYESNKELERFAYVTSHDLNEPLRMVSNFAHLLDEEYKNKLDEEAQTYINFIIDGSKKIQYLINDLLNYNRACRAEVKIQEIQGEDIVLLQGYYLQELIEQKHAELSISSSNTLCADPKLLGQIFYHLIKNGLLYNDDTQPKVNISFTENKHNHLISVRDNGVGIPKEYSDQVFNILKRVNTRPDLTGSGIGLAICKRLITLHDGKIWFENNESQGTTFFFTIKKDLKLKK